MEDNSHHKHTRVFFTMHCNVMFIQIKLNNLIKIIQFFITFQKSIRNRKSFLIKLKFKMDKIKQTSQVQVGCSKEIFIWQRLLSILFSHIY